MIVNAIIGSACDFGIRGQNATKSCIRFSINKSGIQVDPGHFFHESGLGQLIKGKSLFLFSDDIGYRECLERYPKIYPI